jgi:hypothetical protein
MLELLNGEVIKIGVCIGVITEVETMADPTAKNRGS